MTDRLDPITAEIIRGNLIGITNEMKTNLMRTAYNQIIYEAQDFTVGLFDSDGETVSIGLGLPMFVGGLSHAVKAMIEHFGRDGIDPGDVLLTNDGFLSGSHLNHIIVVLPVFADGRIVAFSASMAHWADVGGVLGGTTHDIYSEGFQFPMVKIVKAGVEDRELLAIIELNVRFSNLALGDLRAQLAAVRTGEARIVELAARYGADVLDAAFQAMFDASEKRARAAVLAIPDGEYRASAEMDDDGVRVGQRVPIDVTVRIEGDRFIVDLSRMSPQVPGYYNSGEAAGLSAVHVAFKALTSPTEGPVNAGSFRPAEVILPPGTVVSAQRPAAMRWWMTYPMTLVDCIFRALAPAVPNLAIAGHHADIGVATAFGEDSETGRLFVFVHAAQGGGWGARRDADGESATICINDGDTHNTPIEANEVKRSGLLATRYELRPDSGGAGRRRGGLGTTFEWQVEAGMRFNSSVERTVMAPWGLEGGTAAFPNAVRRREPEGGIVTLPSGKADSLPLAPGESFIVETGGGGGFGDPAERPATEVLADVTAGYVSVDAARELYRVAIDGDQDGWRIDEPATAELRRTR
ncbi:hydantoinase B/oxoprolinase family protein [Amnibacterium flavum]|uniref:5-oxoprolinase n=1 Tax=Amnibacterium flavum TaxID=2173173 RepID=A0A2V1HVH5_9MICO|nr:hydantoinase B/oxoprolinase family protein [Amnibacterium flavum]PVZ95742.1 5-oxoprolinase [Amnibacterium flavum]